MGQGGGQGGVDGWGDQRAVWEQQSVHWFHLLGSLKNLTIGLIWLVTRGGGVGGVGQGGGQGAVDGVKLNNWSDLAGDEGGGVGGSGSNKAGSLYLNNWSDLAGDEGGRRGGCGPGRRARGVVPPFGDGGGHQRAVWEHRFHLFTSLENLTIGLIW